MHATGAGNNQPNDKMVLQMPIAGQMASLHAVHSAHAPARAPPPPLPATRPSPEGSRAPAGRPHPSGLSMKRPTPAYGAHQASTESTEKESRSSCSAAASASRLLSLASPASSVRGDAVPRWSASRRAAPPAPFQPPLVPPSSLGATHAGQSGIRPGILARWLFWRLCRYAVHEILCCLAPPLN